MLLYFFLKCWVYIFIKKINVQKIYVAAQPVPPPFEMTTPLYVYNVVVRIL